MRRYQGWLLAGVIVLALVSALHASGLKSGVRTATATVTQSGTVDVAQTDTVSVIDVTEYDKYMCYAACAPASKTTARAIDHANGDYYEASWTIIHDTNTKGSVTIFDLSGGAVVDSLVGIRLLAGLTYGGDEIVGDSIAVFIWDADDTCYIFGKGTSKFERDWQGD